MTDVHGPRYVLDVEGNILLDDVLQDVVSVNYESVDFGIGTINIVVNNAPDKNGDLRYIDSNVWAEGNSCKLWIGYGVELFYVGEFFFIDHLPKFSANFPTLQIVGYDPLFKLMNDGRFGRSWKNDLLIEDIVAQINVEGGYNLGIVTGSYASAHPVTDTGQGGDVQPLGDSYFDYLRKTAEQMNFRFFLKQSDAGSDIWYGRKDDLLFENDQYEKRTFKYKQGEESSIIDFSPRISTNYVPTKVIGITTIRNKGQTIISIFQKNTENPEEIIWTTGNIRDAKIQSEIQSAASIRNTLGQPMVQFVSKGKFANEREALDFAEQYFKEREESYITGSLVIPGVPELRSLEIHTLEGLGARLSGDYYFSSVRHNLPGESDYTCQCEVNKVATDD